MDLVQLAHWMATRPDTDRVHFSVDGLINLATQQLPPAFFHVGDTATALDSPVAGTWLLAPPAPKLFRVDLVAEHAPHWVLDGEATDDAARDRIEAAKLVIVVFVDKWLVANPAMVLRLPPGLHRFVVRPKSNFPQPSTIVISFEVVDQTDGKVVAEHEWMMDAENQAVELNGIVGEEPN